MLHDVTTLHPCVLNLGPPLEEKSTTQRQRSSSSLVHRSHNQTSATQRYHACLNHGGPRGNFVNGSMTTVFWRFLFPELPPVDHH